MRLAGGLKFSSVGLSLVCMYVVYISGLVASRCWVHAGDVENQDLRIRRSRVLQILDFFQGLPCVSLHKYLPCSVARKDPSVDGGNSDRILRPRATSDFFLWSHVSVLCHRLVSRSRDLTAKTFRTTNYSYHRKKWSRFTNRLNAKMIRQLLKQRVCPVWRTMIMSQPTCPNWSAFQQKRPYTDNQDVVDRPKPDEGARRQRVVQFCLVTKLGLVANRWFNSLPAG